MLLGVKRERVYEEDFYERYRADIKRYRAECEEEEASEEHSSLLGSPAGPSAEDLVKAALHVANFEGRSQQSRSSSCMEDTAQDCSVKRLRVAGPSAPDPCEDSSKEAIRRGAEATVRALKGCQSVEEAQQRAYFVLEEFQQEVRQATLNEVERSPPRETRSADSADERAPDDGAASPQALQEKNRTLMRAVYHLAERCKRFEAGCKDMPALRKELEDSKEAQRRLQHANELLQSHLRLHLSECSDRPLPWGNIVH